MLTNFMLMFSEIAEGIDEYSMVEMLAVDDKRLGKSQVFGYTF